MYEMSQRQPVWVAENHVKPCNSVEPKVRDEISFLLGDKKSIFKLV
jgi:hypothetical protein